MLSSPATSPEEDIRTYLIARADRVPVGARWRFRSSVDSALRRSGCPLLRTRHDDRHDATKPVANYLESSQRLSEDRGFPGSSPGFAIEEPPATRRFVGLSLRRDMGVPAAVGRDADRHAQGCRYTSPAALQRQLAGYRNPAQFRSQTLIFISAPSVRPSMHHVYQPRVSRPVFHLKTPSGSLW